jgi:hypothetical protein
MAYTLNRYSGLQLTVLEDGTLDASTSLSLVGRNYTGYGGPQNENFLYLLENFSNKLPPTRPLSGQLWYNSNANKLNVFDGNNWKSSASATFGADAPVGADGDFWYNSTIGQLNVYANNAWHLIGPEAVPGFGETKLSSIVVYDTSGFKHPLALLKVNGVVEAVIASESFEINDVNPIVGFNTLSAGINIKPNSLLIGALKGNADTATHLQSAVKINSVFFDGSADITVKASTPFALQKGDYIVGGNFDGSVLRSWSVDASTTATPGKIVARNASGSITVIDIAARDAAIRDITGRNATFTSLTADEFIGAVLTGNASTATQLQTARNINGVLFNGTADITVTAAAGTLTGTRLNPTITESNLTSFGVVNTLVTSESGIVIDSTFGIQNHHTDKTDIVSSSTNGILITVNKSADGSLGGQAGLAISPVNSTLSTGTDVPSLNPIAPNGFTLGTPAQQFKTVYSSYATIGRVNTSRVDPTTGEDTITLGGNVVVEGDFTVNGNVTTIHSTNMQVDDIALVLANGAANPTAANGAGISIDGAGAALFYTVAGNKWNVNKDFDAGTNDFITTGLYRGTATAARYADLAENYVADAQYVPGEVLEFGGDFEVTIAQDGTTKVAGVVSTHPAHLMNSDCQGQYVVAVALQGRVPVKVRGEIRKGDMLIAAGSGFARRTTNPQIGTIIGKALEDFDGIEGVIEVVVGRI